MNHCFRVRRILTIFIFGCAALANRGVTGEPGATLKLPPFIVEGTAGPTWRYAQFPGYEILSRCDDAKTEQLFMAFHRAHELLDAMLPVHFQIQLDVPKAMIFYDEELWPFAKQETVAAMLRLNPPSHPETAGDDGTQRQSARDALVPRGGLSALGLKPRQQNQESRFFENMCLSDTDSIATFALVSRAMITGQDTYLTPAYVETLLNRRTPQLPAWFRAGFLTLYGKLKVHDGTLTIMRHGSADVTSSTSRHSFSVSPTSLFSPGKRLLNLEEQDKTVTTIGPSYLGVASFAALGKTLAKGVLPIETVLDERALENGINESVWLAETELFVRWGIAPSETSRTEAFWKFVERSVSEPTNEKLFQECFGLSSAQVSEQLTAFLPKSEHLAWRMQKEEGNSSSLELRDATRGEISRIKGEWERLETCYIRKNLPEFETPFLTQARKTLHRAFDRGDRDPRLLATLGLLELDAGESRAARGYLEDASSKGQVRPRANFELGRLRYEETDGRSNRDDGKISSEQASSIVGPLLLACRQKPSIPQVYELMSDAWVNCAAPPPTVAMGALKEGVRLFPKDGELVYRVALLNAVSDPQEAAELIDLELQYAPNETDKIRFLELRRKLTLPAGPEK